MSALDYAMITISNKTEGKIVAGNRIVDAKETKVLKISNTVQLERLMALERKNLIVIRTTITDGILDTLNGIMLYENSTVILVESYEEMNELVNLDSKQRVIMFSRTNEELKEFIFINGKFVPFQIAGPKGERGPKGEDGKDGMRGEQGPRGFQGVRGADGERGQPGPQGPAGQDGEDGEKGEKGNTGPQGLKGDKGEKGDTGPAGKDGEKGEKGDKGDTGPQGPQGLKGEKGDAGPKGEKGDTGPQGLKGDKGEKGDTGPAGKDGLKGEKGDVGPQGPQGLKGDTGPAGKDGLKGEKGDVGPQGPQGLKGVKGDKGDKGEKGDTGPQGEKGEGAVASVDGILPDANGNVTLNHANKTDVATALNDAKKYTDEKIGSVDFTEIENSIANNTSKINAHEVKKDNPHSVTKSQVGLGSVDNVKQASKDEHDRLAQSVATHLAEKATQNEYGHIRLQDIPTPTKASVGLGNVDNVKQMPISGGILENYREKLSTVSASGGSINLSLGNVFVHTPSGNRTYSITNAVNGQAHSFTLIISMGSTVRTLTFPSSVKWQDGEIPDMSEVNKTYVLTFVTIDGGSTWLGMFGGEF